MQKKCCLKVAEASFPEHKKVRKILAFPDFWRFDTIFLPQKAYFLP